MKLLLMCLGILLYQTTLSQKTENLIIVTIDGVRWEEVFKGVDTLMSNQKKYAHLNKKYLPTSTDEAYRQLMPFLHNTVKSKGILWGDTSSRPLVEVENKYWFSYPGYNELFTGYADSSINSNDKIYNRNINFLEKLSKHKSFENKIAVFGSWDRFRYILNEERAGILVNDGYRDLKGDLNDVQKLLNHQQHEFPKLFHDAERLDYFTFYHAFEYLKKEKPRVLVIALGDSDEFAHSGDYDLYVDAIHQADQWIEILWNYIQNNDHYKNKTSMIITTDHGRGNVKNGEWTSHGSNIIGANKIWMGIIGPMETTLPKVEKVYLSNISGWVLKELIP